MSIAQLEKIAKTATGERRRMAQWNLNMKRGRKKENLDPATFNDTGKSSPYGSGYQAIREYTPSNPGNIDKAIREIEALGIRNPINPKEIVIDNSVIIEVSNWDKRLWFSSLYSIERGQGNATRIMQKIVDIADKYKVTIALDPHPFGKGTGRLSRSQLVKFYKKFGFEFEDGQEDFGDMERIAERINLFVERNIPTNPEKWSYYKSQAKKKFDVYPSAYANAWAAKMYKKAGGGWRKGK
jgi:prophage maintenance system killer protein